LLFPLCQRRLGLGQPERHIHRAVELDGGGQVGTGLFSASHLAIQAAEAKVAVGLERTHAEFISQGEGLAVVRLSLLGLRRLTIRRDLTLELRQAAV
jgi:hypothetical protein